MHQQTYRYLHYAVSNPYFRAPLDLPLLGCSCLLLYANTEVTFVPDTFFKIRNVFIIKLQDGPRKSSPPSALHVSLLLY